METKPLLYGLIGFILGGLIVSVAATELSSKGMKSTSSEVSMSEMTNSLKDLKGDEYDKTFITHMISHHQSAVDMAKLSADRAKHQEIKDLSLEIISAQDKEITHMKQWQSDWAYMKTNTDHSSMGH